MSLDIVLLDEWLVKELGFDYNTKEGISMEEAISKYYGEDAVTFIKNAI